jgi:hypothetical protein
VIRKGICHLDDLQSLRGMAPNRHISCSLLRRDELGTKDSIQAFEMIIRDLELSSGVCRTTYRGRLRELDVLVGPYLLESFVREGRLEVHDWAASDGLVSSEWALDLFRIFPECQFTASDLTLYLIEVYRGNREAYIFEPGGVPLQYVFPPFVIPFSRRESAVFFANRLVRMRAERCTKSMQSIVSQYRWTGFDDPNEYVVPPFRIRILPLVHPEAFAMHRQMPRFKIIRHSVMSTLAEPVHVIRTMNIYQHRYFSNADIAKGVRAVFDSLVLGGIWILGRTVEERKPVCNESCILRKTESGFQVLRRLNGGSELEESLRAWGLINGEEYLGSRWQDSGGAIGPPR